MEKNIHEQLGKQKENISKAKNVLVENQKAIADFIKKMEAYAEEYKDKE